MGEITQSVHIFLLIRVNSEHLAVRVDVDNSTKIQTFKRRHWQNCTYTTTTQTICAIILSDVAIIDRVFDLL